MATEKLSNSAITTLALSTNASATSISVSAFSMFPPSGDFRILVDNELMLVTAGSSTSTWTVTRGIENTTAVAHAAGAQVALVITSAGLLKYVQENVRNTLGWQTLVISSVSNNTYSDVTFFTTTPIFSVTLGTTLILYPVNDNVILGDNTGNSTLTVSGVGPYPIYKNYNQPLDPGDIKASQFMMVVFLSSNWVLITPPAGSIRGPRTTVVDQSIPIYSGTSSNLIANQSNYLLPTDGSMRMQNGVLNNNKYYLYNTTTNATQTELFVNGSSTRMPILALATTWNFRIYITAKTSGNNTQSACWKIEGGIHRNNSTVSFMGTPTVTNLGDSVSGAWSVAVVADGTNNVLGIKVTGQVGQTIRWVANVETVELTY